MSYDLINRKDPRIDTIFKGLENMERMIDAIRTAPRPAFHGDYFLTDEELSKLLKVSRRTLQEYRTLGMIPYYLVQGKPFTKSQTYKKFLTTHIKDAGKNSDGYEAKVKETASLQGRFFVVGQLVSEFPSPFLDNNLFFVQTKSSVHSGCFQPFHVLVHFPVSHFGIKLRGLNTHVPHHLPTVSIGTPNERVIWVPKLCRAL